MYCLHFFCKLKFDENKNNETIPITTNLRDKKVQKAKESTSLSRSGNFDGKQSLNEGVNQGEFNRTQRWYAEYGNRTSESVMNSLLRPCHFQNVFDGDVSRYETCQK